MAPTKKNYAKAKVWGERITTTLEGPLMGVIQQMLTSVPADNHEYLLGKLKQISDDIRGITTAEPVPSEDGLLTTLEGCMKAIDRLCYKHDPDSIEAEWIGHANEAIRKAKGEA